MTAIIYETHHETWAGFNVNGKEWKFFPEEELKGMNRSKSE